MGLRVEQAALVELAVHLDQQVAELAQKATPTGASLTKARLRPSAVTTRRRTQLASTAIALVLGNSAAAGWSAGSSNSADDGALLGAGAHQAAVAAAAECQAQRVEDDRLAGAGLAGEHGQAAGEAELQAVDQHDVADREALQHRRLRAGARLRSEQRD